MSANDRGKTEGGVGTWEPPERFLKPRVKVRHPSGLLVEVDMGNSRLEAQGGPAGLWPSGSGGAQHTRPTNGGLSHKHQAVGFFLIIIIKPWKM